MASAAFNLQKLELEIDTIPLLELQGMVNMAEMQVKEKEMQIKDLKDMLTTIEIEKDNKENDILKLERRLQEVMVTLKEKQEDLFSMHLSKNVTQDQDSSMSQEMRQHLEHLMNGNLPPAANGTSKQADKNEPMVELESVGVSCPRKLGDLKVYFRVTQNFDFHALLLASVNYFGLQTPEIADNEIDQHFQLVGPKNRIWPLEGRVVDVLKKEQDWFIEIHQIVRDKAVVVQESESEDDVDDGKDDIEHDQPGVLHYPPKYSRPQIFRELIMFVVFATFFLLVLYSGRTVKEHQLVYQVHREAIIENNFGPNGVLTFQDVGSWEEFWMWVEGPLSDGLFPYRGGTDNSIGAPASELALYNKLVGGVRFLQNRAPNRTFENCGITNKGTFTRINNATKEKDFFFEYCYKPYDENNYKERNPFGDGSKGFFYQSANHSYHVSGDFGRYDNSGYMYDVDDINPDGVSWQAAIDHLKGNNWVDLQTRAVQIEFLTYNANFDLFASMLLVVEFTASGFMNAHFVIETFSVGLWQGWRRGHPSAINIIETIVFTFVVYYAYQEIKEMKMCRKITGGLKDYFKQIWNVVDCLIIGVYFSTVGARLWFFFEPRRWNLNLFHYGYTEFYDIARLYNTAFELDSGVVLLLSFKLFKYFQLSASTAMLWNTLVTAGASITYFLFMFVVILVGFSLMGTSLFGSVLLEYSTFGRTFETLLLMLLGEFDYERLQKVDDFWAPFFFCLYMIFVVFVLLNIFLAILNEAYGTESARLAEQRMLGSKKMNKLMQLMKIARQTLNERKQAKARAKQEALAYQLELAEMERLEKEGKAKMAAIRSGLALKSGVGAIGKGLGINHLGRKMNKKHE